MSKYENASIDIESAYLNANQEQAVENILNFAKHELGFEVPFGDIFIPMDLRTIRIMVEAKVARDFIFQVFTFIEDKSLKRKIGIMINQFDKAYDSEIEQIEAGEQEFVSERDEADQV